MITEAIILGSGYLLYNKIKNKEQYKIDKAFRDIVQEHNLRYKIIESRIQKHQHILIVSTCYDGYDKLEKLQDELQSTFGYMTLIEQNENYKTATISIIVEKLTDDYKFVPVKCKPYELYLAKTYTMSDVIVSMKNYPHMLYSGINNSGKTYCMLTAVTNLINQFTKRDIELYLAQVSSKKDLRKFKDVEMCRGFSQNIYQALNMFQHLYSMMEKRISMFNSITSQCIDDIYEWNKAFPKRKMRIVYLVMDEFSAFMSDKLDNDEEKEVKDICMGLLIKFIQQSRCCGIYLLTSLQRTDKESIPPRLKCQFNCKVSFKQSNLASSLTVCDSDKAFKLKNREAVVSSDTEKIVKTLYLDNEMIKYYIQDKIDKSNSNYYNISQQNNIIVDNKNTNQKKKQSKKKTTNSKSHKKICI